MLGEAKKLFKCQSQSAIRHKVRKLRAKVRSIIPMDVCQTHNKRNQQVQKMNFRRTQQTYLNRPKEWMKLESQQKDEKMLNSLWKLGTLKLQQWYIVNNNHNICPQSYKNYEFHKLRQDQIELINEDKIYYLGQKNIQPYNNFLKTLQPKVYQQPLKRNTLIKSTRQNIKKLNENQDRQLSSYSLWNHKQSKTQQPFIKNKSAHKSSFSSSFNMVSNSTLQRQFKTSSHRHSTTSISKFNTNYRFVSKKLFSTTEEVGEKKIKTAEQRKQFVQQKQKQKKMYQKLKMDIQTAKVQSNQREIKNQQLLKIKEYQDSQRQKQQKAVKKKSILMKKGEIAKIGTELRSLMIRRRQNNIEQAKMSKQVQPNPFLSTTAQ